MEKKMLLPWIWCFRCDDGDSVSSVANNQPLISSRVDGVDSGTTSESDETYKAPMTDSAGKQSIVRQSSNMDVAPEILYKIESTEAHNAELSQRGRYLFLVFSSVYINIKCIKKI